MQAMATLPLRAHPNGCNKPRTPSALKPLRIRENRDQR